MINRADAFWAWVWDGKVRPGSPRERLVIAEFDDGGCIACAGSSATKEDYLAGEADDFTGWKHYERIPEPKKRLMNREEILGFIAWNPHIVVKIQDEIPQRSNKFSFIRDVQMYSWAPITEAGEIGEWSKFELTEIE